MPIIEYLVNKLYREYRDDVKMIDFFLPQLCYMCITKEVSIPLERFLLQMATRWQVIGLKMLHWFQAMSEDDNLPYAAKAADLAGYVESAIVNGSIPSKF